ncbi:MAG: T9SS type A sorting domain-containing protein [Vicingus serpentipes]|nr:T9SS type A sorting domain-containing protein [Vicingus serpentipes]
MKKYLLFAFTLGLISSAGAQNKNAAARYDFNKFAFIDDDSQNQLIKPISIPYDKASSKIPIGTSYNIYGILGDRQNQVVYNAATNTVAFVHRQNNGGSGPAGKESGVMSFDYSTDGGATWTVNPFQTTPTLGGFNGNRYPNIGLYNPTSNTDPANAFLIQVGPALDLLAGESQWTRTFRSSFKLDGSNLEETYSYNSILGPNNDPNDWAAAGLFVNAQGHAWYVSTTFNNQGPLGSENPAYNVAGDLHDYFLHKGVFNAGNNNFDWTTVDTITPNWYTTSVDGTSGGAKVNVAGLANMAWSPNGMVGYMVAMGADSNANQNTQIRPYVVKTTDAGVTWNKVADFDFSTDFTINCGLRPIATTGAKRTFFSAYDMVVDANGELRIFANVRSGFSDHPDSLNYFYSFYGTGNLLYEVATKGSGWEVTYIDSIYVADFEWDATNTLSHYVRPQAARSQDGTKVFYTWLTTDPLLSLDREFLNMSAVGHDINTDKWTPVTDLTVGVSGAEYVTAYPTIAVETIENGSDKEYEIATVFATDFSTQADVTNGQNPTQWNFLKGVGFDQADFTRDTVNLCALANSIDDNNNINDISISVYPNPTNGILDIQLSTNAFNYTITDIVGNIIANDNVVGGKTTIDLSNNALGVYLVTINTENGSTTKKVLLTK